MSVIRHWKTILGLLIVFMAGVVIGGLGTVRIVQRVHARNIDSATWTPRTLAWLNDEITLTPDQEGQVRQSVEKMTHELIDLRTDAEERRRAIFGRMLIDVASHITPEQQQRLKAAIREKETSNNSPIQ